MGLIIHHFYGTRSGWPHPPLTAQLLPEHEPAAIMAPMGALSGSSRGGCVLPLSDHQCHDCIYQPNACLDSGWPKGGEEHHEHIYLEEPTSRREPTKKQKELAIAEWRAVPKSGKRGIPLRGLRPHGSVRRRTHLCWGTSIPPRKMF